MRVSKVRNSPRIVLKSTLEQSELNYDEVLKTDVNSDGFADKYIVTDELDGENSNGEQRIFADEITEAEEFLFTPETDTVSTDVVSIENVEAGIMDAGNGRTPDMKMYGTTLVNLLGKYGNFEVDTNADGLADGWSVNAGSTRSIETTPKLFGSKAQKITDDTAYSGISRNFSASAGDIVFLSGYAYVSIVGEQRLVLFEDANFTIENVTTTGWNRLSIKKELASGITNYGVKLLVSYGTGATGNIAIFDGIVAVNLTAAGALDPVRQAKYGVANWEDLTEEQLEAEIPYFDSVMSVNVEDGTASELTVENRGKNLVPNFHDYYTDSGIYSIQNVDGEECLGWAASGATSSTPISGLKFKYNTQYVFTADLKITSASSGLTIRYMDGTFDTIIVPSEAFVRKTFVSDENKTIKEIAGNWNSGQLCYLKLSTFQIEEGSVATDHVPPREDSITIPDTVELHGFDGVFNYIDSNGNYTKNWERADKTTDASCAFALTGYASGSKVICRNKTNGEVEVLDAAASVTTSWTEESIEILYQLEVPTLTSESLTGSIKLYQGQNNILSPDSSVPVAINVVNLNNDVTTSNNIVNIDNIINTASYEWNAGNLTSWSMSGRSFVNLLHDSEEVPDGYSRHFKSLDGNTYFDYLNATLITGDNTYTFVTNSSGDTASMAVYNLTELGSLTTLEASAANTLAEEVLYDTDTLWEDLPEAILTEMLPPYIARYTKEYTTSYIKPISNTVEHHEIPIDLPLLGLNSYNNVINSDGTGTEYAKISDLSEGSFIYLDEVDDIDYVEIELDYDLSQELEIPEIGVCWDYSSDVSTLTRRVLDTAVEVVWDYSSDVSTLSRRAI